MNLYVVFDHYYSGIIQSQVIDVVEAVEKNSTEEFKIVAFVNIRRLKEAKKKYNECASRVIVLPNFGFARWKWSMSFLAVLCFLFKPKVIIGRSVFANQLGLAMKKIGLAGEVVLDARGAEFAEWNEYFFKNNEGPISNEEVKALELHSVNKSDRLISVSKRLTEYWEFVIQARNRMADTTIIPSTLSSSFLNSNLANYHRFRKKLGVSEDEILLVFSGSDSDWHALDQVLAYCDSLAQRNTNLRFLFLTNAELDLEPFPSLKNRLIQKWLAPNEVSNYLAACDYGLLLRNDSWTNKVSSPVKLAEYLSCGNRVIISDNIGDYPELVKLHELGMVISKWNMVEHLKPVSMEEKQRISSFGKAYFSKKNFLASYQAAFFGE